MTVASQNRRERQRKATLSEIVGISRSLLSAGQDVSLRAVAAELGVTPPALYRYVPSVQGLQEYVSEAIVIDLCVRLRADAAHHPQSDPAARLVAAAAAFRQWAIRHRPEFRLIFITSAGAISQDLLPPSPQPIPPLTSLVLQLVLELWEAQHGIASNGDPAAPGDTSAGVQPVPDGQLRDRAERMPEALKRLVVLRWIQLYGVIALESFRHVDRATIASGDVFKQSLREALEAFGIGSQWQRLAAVADATTTGWSSE